MERFRNYIRTFLSITGIDIENVISFFETAKLAKNEYLVEERKVCRYLNFIESGVVRFKKYEEDGWGIIFLLQDLSS
jgi:hypothetical protein